MLPDRSLVSKKNRPKSGPYARDNRADVAPRSMRDGTESALSRILSKLGHLKFTSDCVVGKDPVKDAHGGYCDVYVGHISSTYLQRRTTCTEGGQVKVAIKALRVHLNEEKRVAKTLAREMDVWSKLKHPNILPFLGFIIEKGYPSLISEWVEHGTLRKFLKKCTNPDIVRLSLGIAEGLKYMHDRNFVHSDLKADNVLVSTSGDPLICDFGISRVLTSSESDFVSTTHDGRPRGTARWMAIELHVPEDGVEPRHSKESDVWAFGMTLYEMLAKEVPYAHLKYEVHVLSAVMKGELPTLPDLQTDMNLSPFLYSMICAFCKGCWARSPVDRPTMTQITLALSSLLNGMARQQHQSGLTGLGRLDVPFSEQKYSLMGTTLLHETGHASESQGQFQCSVSSGPPDGLDQGHESRNESPTQTIAPGRNSSLKADDDESESMQTLRANIVEDTNKKNFITGARFINHRDNYASLETLARTLIERFKHGGGAEHLMEAIELCRSALALQSEGHPDRSLTLNNLGYSLKLRFRQGGAIEDITESIECHRSALALHPEGHPDRSWSLNELGYSLWLRSKQGGAIEDITESIECHRSALALHPEGHPDRSLTLNNLGSSLYVRFEQGGAIEDITESIECHRSALALRPEGHPKRSQTLNGLGSSLYVRFEQGGAIEDITESIECHRSALALRPEGHPKRSQTLNNLENALYSRSRRSGSVEVLEGSIEHRREALPLSQAQQSTARRNRSFLKTCLSKFIGKRGRQVS
ncbi:hypothetical protein ACEPAH_8098 [Sanghuangporus vaninii]